MSGIVYDFEVYEGSADGKKRKPSRLGLGGDVVIKMVSGLEENKNYKIFADNFLFNLALLEALKKKGMFFVGTFRANRLKGCELKPEKELKAMGRGSCDFKVEVLSNVIAVRWFDNKPVDTISSYIGLEPWDEVERYSKKDKKKVAVRRPGIVKEYNSYMGGVDLLDSLSSLYKFPIKSRQWYIHFLPHDDYRCSEYLAVVQATRTSPASEAHETELFSGHDLGCSGTGTDRLPRWPSGKASASRAEGPGFESRLRRDFFGVESCQ